MFSQHLPCGATDGRRDRAQDPRKQGHAQTSKRHQRRPAARDGRAQRPPRGVGAGEAPVPSRVPPSFGGRRRPLRRLSRRHTFGAAAAACVDTPDVSRRSAAWDLTRTGEVAQEVVPFLSPHLHLSRHEQDCLLWLACVPLRRAARLRARRSVRPKDRV